MLTRTRSSAEPLVRSSAGIKRIRREITTIPRTPTPPQQQSTTAAFNFSILSANVAGLRGVLKSRVKSENLKQSLLQAKPDILCLQEHKLQEQHIEDVQLQLKELLLRLQGKAKPSIEIYCRFLAGLTTPLFTKNKVRQLAGFASCEKLPYQDIRNKVLALESQLI